MDIIHRADWPPYRLLPFLEATVAPGLALLLHLELPPLHGHLGLWLFPLLIALRYGLAFALYTSLLFALGLLSAGVSWSLLDWGAGGFLVLVAGWLSDLKESHLLAERRLRRELEGQLERVLGQLYLARATAKSLQTHLLCREATLLTAVEAWQERVAQGEGEERLWQALMTLLAPLANLHVAGLYRYRSERLEWEREPVAQLGAIGPLALEDPLFKRLEEEAWLFGRFVTVADLLEEERSHYLAVLPLRWREELFGALVVRDMPARQLEEATLRLLFAVLTIAAWTFWLKRQEGAEIWASWPEMPPEFFHHLLLACELRREGLPSTAILLKRTARFQLEKALKERLRAPLMADFQHGDRLLRLLLLKDREEVALEAERLEAELGTGIVLEVAETPPYPEGWLPMIGRLRAGR